MKSKLLAMGSVAALIASPLAMADKSAEGPAVCGVAKGDAEGSAGDETVVDPVVTNDEVLQNTVTEGEATAEPGPKGEPVCDKTPADCEEGHVPIDEVKRGEGELENPDVIFYTTADGGAVAPVATKADIELGQDDKAALIEGKGTATPLVKREKKGPVALLKKGRVFLR